MLFCLSSLLQGQRREIIQPIAKAILSPIISHNSKKIKDVRESCILFWHNLDNSKKKGGTQEACGLPSPYSCSCTINPSTCICNSDSQRVTEAAHSTSCMKYVRIHFTITTRSSNAGLTLQAIQKVPNPLSRHEPLQPVP